MGGDPRKHQRESEEVEQKSKEVEVRTTNSSYKPVETRHLEFRASGERGTEG